MSKVRCKWSTTIWHAFIDSWSMSAELKRAWRSSLSFPPRLVLSSLKYAPEFWLAKKMPGMTRDGSISMMQHPSSRWNFLGNCWNRHQEIWRHRTVSALLEVKRRQLSVCSFRHRVRGGSCWIWRVHVFATRRPGDDRTLVD